MDSNIEPIGNSFIMAAILTVIIALVFSLVLTYLLRRRLVTIKYLPGVLVAGHLFAYGLFLVSRGPEGINENGLTWAFVVLALMPAFIIASAIGILRPPTVSPIASANKKDDPGHVQVPGAGSTTETPGNLSLQKNEPTFGEGLFKGLWAFVALMVFYVIYFSIFSVVIRIAREMTSG